MFGTSVPQSSIPSILFSCHDILGLASFPKASINSCHFQINMEVNITAGLHIYFKYPDSRPLLTCFHWEVSQNLSYYYPLNLVLHPRLSLRALTPIHFPQPETPGIALTLTVKSSPRFKCWSKYWNCVLHSHCLVLSLNCPHLCCCSFKKPFERATHLFSYPSIHSPFSTCRNFSKVLAKKNPMQKAPPNPSSRQNSHIGVSYTVEGEKMGFDRT